LEVVEPDAPMDYYRRAIEEERELFARLDFDPDYRGDVVGSIEQLEALKQSKRRVSDADLQRLIALYDRGVAYVDHWIGRLLDGLKERDLYDDTMVIITSDHGEEFLEHGRLGHLYAYYEESLRVPLIIRLPREGRGAVVDEPVGLIDVLPTILDVMEIDYAPVVQGASLRATWTAGKAVSPDYFAEASYEADTAAIRSSRYKYIWNRGRPDQLYQLATDPGEQQNVCDQEPVACRKMRGRLRVHFQRNRELAATLAPLRSQVVELDDRTREQLEVLGYAQPE
jgi:arylsulfatase A-like enzyme